jgi:hypothetical protein
MTGNVPIIHHPRYEVDIGAHVFPTAKYRLIRARLIEEGTAAATDFVTPRSATDEEVALVHSTAYLEKMLTGRLSTPELLTLEVPFSSELREGMWLCAGGSIEAARLALERGLAVHIDCDQDVDPVGKDRASGSDRLRRASRQRHSRDLCGRPSGIHPLDASGTELPGLETAK